jgi:hypothetical protein
MKTTNYLDDVLTTKTLLSRTCIPNRFQSLLAGYPG